jgi:dephospho-CoA kinase
MAIRIVFVGKSKAGKTWAADYLRRVHGFKKIAFAEGLAYILRKFYPYDAYQRVRWETRVKYYDAWYKIDPNIWATYMERRLHLTTRNVVIDDPRYINEVVSLKRQGFTVIRIVAPEAQRTRRLKSVKSGDVGLLAVHDLYNRDFNASVGVDYSIYNDTKDGTRKALDEIIEKLKILDSEQNENA